MLTSNTHRPPARLWVVMARQARTAVVFRRGPSRWFLCLRWNLATDQIEPGEWLADHIYPRRCDLSPDGSLLVYFAYRFSSKGFAPGDHRGEWTAVSRPPWLTPLARWTKQHSGCWAGGGLFTSDTVLALNHQPDEAVADPGFEPVGLSVRPNPDAGGEDEPIFSLRQERDGWQLVQEIGLHRQARGYVTSRPETRRKTHPNGSLALDFERRLDRFHWIETISLVDLGSGERRVLTDLSWADWDVDRIVGVRSSELVEVDPWSPDLAIGVIADLDGYEPEARSIPEWATRPIGD